MAKVATSIAPALFLMLTLASFICAAGLRVPHPGRRMQQDEADEMAMMAGPPMGTGVGSGMGTPTDRGVGTEGTGVSGGMGGGIGIGGGGTLSAPGPGSGLSGFNSGGSGTAGTGIGNFRRATSRGPFRTSAGCILEGSGNKAVTSCMTAGKRRLLHA